MSCTERRSLWWMGLGSGLLAVLSGCSNAPRPPAPAAPSVEPAPTAPPIRPAVVAPPPAAAAPALGPPKAVRTHDELRRQAALRLVAANPQHSYTSESPPVLLAIPVLEVELHPDGRIKRIKRINVLRRPGQAQDTVQLAIDALHRAAPFGNVSRMPEPWKFTETFLFNDARQFKPRTLD